MPAEIRHEVELPFPIERVWKALTDGKEMSQWFTYSEIAPVKGHRFRIIGKPQPGWDGMIRCEVLEVDPPRRIVYSWETTTNAPQRVEWTLTPSARGAATVVRLRHSGFAGFSGWALRLMMSRGWLKHLRASLPDWLRTGAPPRPPYTPARDQLEARG